ncbi:MAG TPA: hypothetical protein VGE13_00190 [Candidatus Saccharimonadales bacterium]
MKAYLLNSLKALLLVPVLALGVATVVPATQASAAANCTDEVSLKNGADCAQGDDQQSDLFGSNGVFKTITNVLLFVIGAISVIMLIIGGIRYTVSGGDSGAVTSAKNTILYAIVGIVVAILAFAVVNFVIGSFGAE